MLLKNILVKGIYILLIYKIKKTKTPFINDNQREEKTGINAFSLKIPMPIYPAAAHTSIFAKAFMPKPWKKYKS